ncbi:hypothetical protein DDE74_08815 [Streptomyces lydicus]|uniref:Uncharacterized protein n=1 Tax=Streptomyces lydicus TaxID=47763 RepID=A0A3Q9K861_9ACTN|nr:hypothetical protein DDE74_08815 [Streptomyces lydicus]
MGVYDVRERVLPVPGAGLLIDGLSGDADPLRPLHDAAPEDSLDRAERACTGTVARPARWSRYVRMLRRLIG